MSNEKESVDNISIPIPVFDKLAGLLTLLQQQDPVDLLRLGHEVQRLNADLVALGNWISMKIKLAEAAHILQEELRHLRGPQAKNGVVICHLCRPPIEVKIDDLYTHDTTLHHAYRSR